MKKLTRHFNHNINRYRRTTQIGSILLILAVPVLNMYGYRQVTGTYYSIRFWELDIIDPALAVQYFLMTRRMLIPMVLAVITPMLIALFLGKIFCGWICPFNLIEEWGDRLRKRFRPLSVQVHNRNPKSLPYWLILAGLLIFPGITGIPLITFISMPGLLSAQSSDLILAGGIGVELALVPLILVIEMFYKERFWCRSLCPVGAVLAIFRFRYSLYVLYEPLNCGFQCSDQKKSLCNEVCPVQLNPRQKGIYPFCLNCGACVEACQKHGGQALRFGFGIHRRKHSP